MLKLTGSTHTILTEGMGGRMKTNNGQLVPLKKRLNKHQQVKRQEKIRARSTVAAILTGRQNQLAMVLNNLLSRGFFGRLKWVITGR